MHFGYILLVAFGVLLSVQGIPTYGKSFYRLEFLRPKNSQQQRTFGNSIWKLFETKVPHNITQDDQKEGTSICVVNTHSDDMARRSFRSGRFLTKKIASLLISNDKPEPEPVVTTTHTTPIVTTPPTMHTVTTTPTSTVPTSPYTTTGTMTNTVPINELECPKGNYPVFIPDLNGNGVITQCIPIKSELDEIIVVNGPGVFASGGHIKNCLLVGNNHDNVNGVTGVGKPTLLKSNLRRHNQIIKFRLNKRKLQKNQKNTNQESKPKNKLIRRRSFRE